MIIQGFATGNPHKFQEVKDILGFDLEQVPLNLLEPQEIDVAKIIELKARDAYIRTGKVLLVEDTGLEILAWNGLPGGLIKWFLESVGPDGLLRMMSSDTDRRAIAKTAVAYYDGQNVHTFIGQIAGTIATQLSGQSGFGWDSLFIPEGHTQSFAEMGSQVKNSLSMRKHALEQLKTHLNAAT